MFSCREALLGLALALATLCAAAQMPQIGGIGRPATPKELAAWDIDVRADFKGLPVGSGSVAKGMEIWEGQCASCHGVFGESNEVFTPLIGGTTKADVVSGRAARLTDDGYPGRTTLMKLSTLSTLWDYINRAMPWNNPKSLKPDEVYAVVAYMLNLGGVLPDDFVLSDRNMAEVQKRLPNRAGMSTDHALWPGRSLGPGRPLPDVKAAACMKDCATEATVKSYLPDHARNAHGNLAEQNRLVGAQRGADTTVPPGTRPAVAAATPKPGAPAAADPAALFKKHSCNACHGIENKIVGPGMREVGKKLAGRSDAVSYLADRIVSGGVGAWGSIPMPAQSLSTDDARTIARWVAEGAKP